MPDIFKKIQSNDVTGVKEILKSGTVSVDTEDENGITPLLHSSYKGNLEMVQLLLDHGADVNGGHHVHGYTALHFGALSGKPDICSLLLDAGVKVHPTNTVGRTAAQMAAFVGNRKCVTVINNYVPKEAVEYYTVIQGLEKEPRLSPYLVDPVHKLIMQLSIHPVKVAQFVGKNRCLMDNLVQVYKVLELMCEREMKQKEVNEILSLRYHLLQFMLREIEHERQEGEKRAARNIGRELCPCPGKKVNVIDAFIRRLLKLREDDNIEEYQENFLREAVRGFPYKECTLFQQLVTNFAQIKVGEGASAFMFITQVINGQHGFTAEDPCMTCGEEKAPKKCSICKSAPYCDRACQKLHWFVHKKFCSKLAEEYKERVKKEAEQKEAETKNLKEGDKKKEEVSDVAGEETVEKYSDANYYDCETTIVTEEKNKEETNNKLEEIKDSGYSDNKENEKEEQDKINGTESISEEIEVTAKI